jgi:hypothetical protein
MKPNTCDRLAVGERVMKAHLTLIENHFGPCSKSFTLTAQGLQKSAAANVFCGLATRRSVANLEELNAVIEGLGSNQALAFGVGQFNRARIVTQEALGRRGRVANAVARDREHFSWPKDRGIMYFDVDRPKDGSKPLKAKEFDTIMCRLHPWWSGTARMYRPSASSFIYDAETGEELIGGGSLRVYVFIDKAENIPFVGMVIADAFWKVGYGRIEFSEAESMLIRCPVDLMVWQPERLDFAGPVVLGPGLRKDHHPARIIDGTDVDSEAVLDAYGMGKVDFGVWSSNSLEVRKAKSAYRPEEKQRKRRLITKRTEADVAAGMDRKQAERKWRGALLDGVLSGNIVLHFTDGDATVADVLAQPWAYDRKRLADPVEPGCYGDNRIAIFFSNEGRARPWIFSHAHGGRKFALAA